MGEWIKSYKGFNPDMTCRGFQYEEGKEYETEAADCCNSGFHACGYPLDAFKYYYPANSVFHEVEQGGELSRGQDDTKVASTKLKVGASINIAGMVKAAIEYTTSRTKKEAGAEEPHGASSATGDYGASSATGDCGASSATGDCGASSATGYCGASSATGDYGASSATGRCGASSATGDCGASSATGDRGASSATGRCGASSATGYRGASSAGSPDAIAVAWGPKSKAMGVLGSHLVLADWEEDDGDEFGWTLKGARMVRVDGVEVKPDTWYRIEGGQVIEDEEEADA